MKKMEKKREKRIYTVVRKRSTEQHKLYLVEAIAVSFSDWPFLAGFHR